MTAFGHPRRHYRVTDSTNERARELAAAGAPGGTVVTAGAQTAGRGRRGRDWVAAPGSGLLYSALLRPLEPRHALLPLAVPIAVCEAIESVAPVECRIKWPNDIWIAAARRDPKPEKEEAGDGEAGRKVAGVLIEARMPEWAVIGIGVNVAAAPEQPAELRWPAAAVGHGVQVDEVRAAVDLALAGWVPKERGPVLEAFRRRDALLGREVSWRKPDAGEDLSGIADGVDEDGNLVVALAGGGRAVLGAGEVSLLVGG